MPTFVIPSHSNDPNDRRRHTLLRWWGGWLLASMLLCLAISTRYFANAHLDASTGAFVFRVVMLIGHFATLCAVCLIPALLVALLWPRPRVVVVTGAVCTASVALALLIDTQVYALYRFHINAGVMNLLLGGAAQETFIFPTVMYAEAAAIGVGVVAMILVIAFGLWRLITRAPARPALRRAITATILASIVGFHLTHIWADAVAHEPILEQTAVLPLRYAATAKRFLRAHGFEVRPRQTLEANSGVDRSTLAYPLQPLECRGPADPYNIVFIVIDSWRFDEMNARVTPNIASFAQHAWQFADHRSGGNATRIGVFSLFYAIPGTYWHEMLAERRGPVFIDELQRQRYDIGVFRSAPIFSPEFDRTVFARVPLTRVRSEAKGPRTGTEIFTDDFLAYLDARTGSDPFFAFLFYDSPHSFQVPEEYPLEFRPSAPHVNYLRLNAESDPTPLLNRYRNSLHYVDSLVGEVLERMQARGLFEDTIIIITGDHGQEFNDTGLNYWGHASNFTRYQTGVPMILHIPGREPATITHRTTHFDVVPTLLRDHLGCTSDPATFSVGRSLLDPSNRHPFLLSEYADFAIVQADRIAVVREHGLKLLAPDYSELDQALDPHAVRAALELKTRFFKTAGWRPTSGGERSQATPSLH